MQTHDPPQPTNQISPLLLLRAPFVDTRQSITIKKPTRMSTSEEAFVPDMDRREAMNLILSGAFGVNVLGLVIPYLAFFMPPDAGNGGGDVIAKDVNGNDVTSQGWLATHNAGSRELAEGIKVGAWG